MARKNWRKGAPVSKRGAIESAIARLTRDRSVGNPRLRVHPAQRSAARPFSKRHFAFETLELRLAMAANVVINEFLAHNATGIVDQDSDHSDWIELKNTSASAVNLGGWYLTND